MRFVGLLNDDGQKGSAAIESIFSIVILLFMVLAVVEVAFSLYARNVVAASAHEGARAAAERGRSVAEAETIALETVRGSAGGLVDQLTVNVGTGVVGDRSVVSVVVIGHVKPFGPVPFPMDLRAEATVTSETEIP